MALSKFHTRRATTAADDGARCLQFFDSQLPWLGSQGSGSQWGSTPFSADPAKLAEYREQMATIEKSFTQPWNSTSIQGWIAEVDENSDEHTDSKEQQPKQQRRAVGGLILKGRASDYVRAVLPEQQDVDDPYVFLYFLITDRNAGEAAKGAGAALIELAKNETKKIGLLSPVRRLLEGE